MSRMRNRVLSMLLAGTVCVAVIPTGSAVASAGEESLNSEEMINQEGDLDSEEFVWEAVEERGTGCLELDPEREEGESAQLVRKEEHRADQLRYGDYTYNIQGDGTAEISHYYGTEKSITVPDSIEGKKVTCIGDCAFQNCDTLEHIVIPEGVVVIDSYALSCCEVLKSVELPESLTTMGDHVFLQSTLEHVTIPKGVEVRNRKEYRIGSFPVPIRPMCIERFLLRQPVRRMEVLGENARHAEQRKTKRLSMRQKI